MAIFLDTGQISEIEKYLKMDIIRGVTTNPTILIKSGITGGMQAIKQRSIEAVYVLRSDGYLPWLGFKTFSLLGYDQKGYNHPLQITKRFTFQPSLISLIIKCDDSYFMYNDIKGNKYYGTYADIKIKGKLWGYLCLFYDAKDIKSSQQIYLKSIIKTMLRLFSFILVVIVLSSFISIFIKYRRYMKRYVLYCKNKFRYKTKNPKN